MVSLPGISRSAAGHGNNADALHKTLAMNKYQLARLLGFAAILTGLIHGCKKNDSGNTPTHNGSKVSFTEEFEFVNQLPANGWVFQDNSGNYSAMWSQGFSGDTKTFGWLGFTAYSYTTTPDEFAYSVVGLSSSVSISSWLITPVLNVKDGDKISFYVRGDTTQNIFENRLQVRMNKSASPDVGTSISSVGGFKEVLFDINPKQQPGGFPLVWNKYEYVFSGISGDLDTRIAFRHYVNSGKNIAGIGIDQFKFEVK